MADSLEDDLAIDDNFSLVSASSSQQDGVLVVDQDADAGSDGEGEVWDNQSVMSGGEGDDLRDGKVERKDEKVDGALTAASENKKRKRKENEKARKLKKAIEIEAASIVSVASQPPSYQTDYLFKKMRLSLNKLSEMELDELRIRDEMLQEVEFRKERSIENLPGFLTQALPTLPKQLKDLEKLDLKSPKDSSSEGNGSPFICIITGNAVRATDLARGLRSLLPNPPPAESSKPAKKKSKSNEKETGKPTSKPTSTSTLTVAKLFSRHLKLAAQTTFLKTTKTPLAVGTPNRILALIENESFNLEGLKTLVLDLSWLDGKEMNLLDVKENRDEVIRLLGNERIRKKLGDGKLKLVFY